MYPTFILTYISLLQIEVVMDIHKAIVNTCLKRSDDNVKNIKIYEAQIWKTLKA